MRFKNVKYVSLKLQKTRHTIWELKCRVHKSQEKSYFAAWKNIAGQGQLNPRFSNDKWIRRNNLSATTKWQNKVSTWTKKKKTNYTLFYDEQILHHKSNIIKQNNNNNKKQLKIRKF